jgi:hypothetical protein
VEDGPGVALRDGTIKVTAQIKEGALSDIAFTDLNCDPAESGQSVAALNPGDQTRLQTALRSAFDSVRQDTVTWPAPGHAAVPAWLAGPAPQKKPTKKK